MDFEVWFTIDATDEAAQMCQGWSYWHLFVLQNLQGIVVVLAVLICGLVLLAEGLSANGPDLLKAAIGLLLVVTPMAGFWWLRRRDIQKATQPLASINPLKLRFDSNGLHTFEKNGASNFVPWSVCDGFREGKRVILLRQTGTRQYRTVPKKTVPDADMESIRSAVRSHLPEIRLELLRIDVPLAGGQARNVVVISGTIALSRCAANR